MKNTSSASTDIGGIMYVIWNTMFSNKKPLAPFCSATDNSYLGHFISTEP